ncbi:MAG: molecular chaperone [Candidatus Promineifilaceae bacterium]
MTPHELALARSRTYRLFGLLFLRGIDEQTRPTLPAVPELAQLAAGLEENEAAAEHYQLTAVSVFPYESIFLDPSGLLGGDVSERVSAIYAQNGFEPPADADHIGSELTFLSHLCAAEAQAWSHGENSAASLWHSRQQAFLAAHLLTWLPPLAAAVDLAGSAFYGRLANLTLELAADHLNMEAAHRHPLALPAAPVLAGEDSGLKDIARYLVTPPYSGLFLSRSAISDIARAHSLPRGFGDRAQLLTNLLRTAGQYDLAAAVTADLSALWTTWADIYRTQQNAHPDLTPWILPWQERVEQTAVSLLGITAQIARS